MMVSCQYHISIKQDNTIFDIMKTYETVNKQIFIIIRDEDSLGLLRHDTDRSDVYYTVAIAEGRALRVVTLQR